MGAPRARRCSLTSDQHRPNIVMKTGGNLKSLCVCWRWVLIPARTTTKPSFFIFHVSYTHIYMVMKRMNDNDDVTQGWSSSTECVRNAKKKRFAAQPVAPLQHVVRRIFLGGSAESQEGLSSVLLRCRRRLLPSYRASGWWWWWWWQRRRQRRQRRWR